MRNAPWTPGEDTRLLNLKAKGLSYRELAENLNRPFSGVRERLRWLSMNDDERAHNRFIKNRNRFGKRAGKSNRRLWTAQETELAEQLVSENAKNEIFQTLLGRSGQACRDRLSRVRVASLDRSNTGNKFANGLPSMKVPAHVIEDRNRRLMARMQMDLTGIMCGDPVPGFSALEKRT